MELLAYSDDTALSFTEINKSANKYIPLEKNVSRFNPTPKKKKKKRFKRKDKKVKITTEIKVSKCCVLCTSFTSMHMKGWRVFRWEPERSHAGRGRRGLVVGVRSCISVSHRKIKMYRTSPPSLPLSLPPTHTVCFSFKKVKTITKYSHFHC